MLLLQGLKCMPAADDDAGMPAGMPAQAGHQPASGIKSLPWQPPIVAYASVLKAFYFVLHSNNTDGGLHWWC
jgi:hypothetical protein